MICSPSSNACTTAAHSFSAGISMGVVAVTHVRIGPMPVAVGALEEITSEGLRLGAHFARPPGLARVPGLLILPGFPRGPGGAAAGGNT